MLFKLCYFSLPFGESALAIQNGSFTFPNVPPIPEEIKAIISFLLTSSATHRPNIFQTSYLAFSAANRKCPVFNIQRSPRIELLEAVKIFRMRDRLGANYAKALEKAMNEAYSNTLGLKSPTNQVNDTGKPNEPKILQSIQPHNNEPFMVHSNSSNNPFLQPDPLPAVVPNVFTSDADFPISTGAAYSNPVATAATTTTSVNPRLRPKPKVNINQSLTTSFAVPLLVNTTSVPLKPTPDLVPSVQPPSKVIEPSTSFSEANWQGTNPVDRMMDSMKISHISTESSKSAPERDIFNLQPVQNRTIPPSMPVSPYASTAPHSNPQTMTSSLKSSAFKPYSLTSRGQMGQLEKSKQPQSLSSNPFTEYPGGHSDSPSIMDDNVFGERFDELPRVSTQNSATMEKPQRFQPNYKFVQLILNEEPFSQAPFSGKQIYESKRDHTMTL